MHCPTSSVARALRPAVSRPPFRGWPLLTLLLAIAAQAADPWIGTWKMDPAKSNFPGSPPTDVVLKYEPHEKGFKLTSTGKLQDGTPYNYYFVGAVDSKDYPVFNHNGYQTASCQLEDGKFVVRFKRDGKVVVIHRSEFRDGGKVMFNRSQYMSPSGGDPVSVTGHFDRQ